MNSTLNTYDTVSGEMSSVIGVYRLVLSPTKYAETTSTSVMTRSVLFWGSHIAPAYWADSWSDHESTASTSPDIGGTAFWLSGFN